MPKGGRSKKWEEKLPTTKRETPQIGHFLMRRANNIPQKNLIGKWLLGQYGTSVILS